jgi:lambda family phage tail tape measure protein
MSQVTELLVRIRQQGDDQLVKLQNTFKTLGQQTAAANVNFKELAQELKKVQAGSAQSINNLKGYASAWREIANSVDTTSDEFRIARQEADALDAKLNGFQNNQRAVATNFRNIASAANQAAAAMRTTTGLLRDPLTGAYRGVAGTTQYGAPIGPVMPPDYAGRIAQQQREADAQARRDARRRQIMEQRAAYAGEILGTRDPRTGALIAGGTGQFRAVGTQYAQPIGPALPPAARRRLGLGQIAGTAGTISAAGVFGGIEGLLGAGIGAAFGGPLGAATGGAIGAQVGMARQALGGAATYAAEIAKQRQALQLVTKDTGEYRRALQFIDKTSRDLAIPQEILTRQFTQLTASVKGAGGNVKDAEKAFIGIASGIRGTGGSLQQLDSALTATSQVFSKGKVSAEELRQQIGERLPGAFSLFAQSMGKTPQELDKALENGEVSLQDFQKFAEKLFAEYGENAKIIADGPDAAGDRLRTSLSRLNESIGSLLKPIGAAFQNTFAAIVGAIDAAVRKLNEFFGLGRGRQGQINDLQKILNVTDQRIQAFEKLGGKGGTGLGVIEKGQYDVLVKRRTETFAQLSALRAAEKAATTGTGEPSKGLPGIQPEAKTDKAAEKAAKLQARLAEQRNDIYRKSERFLDKIKETTEDVSLETRLLGGNAFDAFENNYTKAVRAANQETKQLLKQVFDLARAYKEAGGDLNVTPLVQAIDDLNESQMNLAAGEAAQKMSDYWQGLSDTFIAITDQTYAMTRAFEYNNNAIAGLGDGLRGYANNVGTVRNAMSELSLRGIKGVEDSITSLLVNGTYNFREFAVQILEYTTRMIIQQFVLKSIMSAIGFGAPAASSLAAPLSNVSQLNASGIGFNPLAFTGGFGFAMGGIMTGNGPMKLRRYAAGGIASGPQLAMYGEGSRPEAYVPLPDGRSIPVTMKNSMGGDIIVNVDATGSNVQGNESQGKALAGVVAAAVQAELVKQKKPGGLLY